MRCHCGETEVEFFLTIVTIERLPEEVGLFHAAPRCTWAFECHDCLGFAWEAFRPGFSSREEAAAALKEHLNELCLVNLRPKNYSSPRKRPAFTPSQEAR